MDIQWYPGHMTKAKRQMSEDIKLIDLVIELTDARAPQSSRNPDIDDLAKGRARIILLCKADLADPDVTSRWEEHFSKKGFIPVALDARSSKEMRRIQSAIMTVCKEKKERDLKRGIKNRPVRAMVAGIPNVGKSTFINTYAKKACAKTGNRPGVTKGKQWIRLNKDVELLDTPGILWPKFDDKQVGTDLALIGSIKDEILNTDELAIELIKYLAKSYPETLKIRYDVCAENKESVDILMDIAIKRNCLKSGGEADLSRAAALLIDDFRSGRLGRISLEAPDMIDN